MTKSVSQEGIIKLCRDGTRGSGKIDEGAAVLFEEVLSRIESRQFREAFQWYKAHRLNVSRQDWEQFFDALNEYVLYPIEREWTKHGVRRSFRFWSVSEKRKYLRAGEMLIRDLRERFGHASLGYGTVLGFIREGDFIAHDDDIDVLVAIPEPDFGSFDEAAQCVGAFLRERKYAVRGDHLRSHRHVTVEGQTLDVFVGYETRGTVSWLPGPRETILTREVFPSIAQLFHGVEASLPAEPVAYVEKVYGAGWKTPVRRWNHRWDENAKAFKDRVNSPH